MKYYFIYLSTITRHSAQKHKSQRGKLNKEVFNTPFCVAITAQLNKEVLLFYIYSYITFNNFHLNLKREITNLKFKLLNSSMRNK